MILIKLLELCSCNWLTNDFNPLGRKNTFTELDELIIVWCKLSDVSKDCNINMIWKNPKNQEVVSISVNVDKVTGKEPIRRAWTVMETKAAAILNNCFGKWKIEVREGCNTLGIIDFEFKNIKSNNLSLSANSIMDISI